MIQFFITIMIWVSACVEMTGGGNEKV